MYSRAGSSFVISGKTIGAILRADDLGQAALGGGDVEEAVRRPDEAKREGASLGLEGVEQRVRRASG